MNRRGIVMLLLLLGGASCALATEVRLATDTNIVIREEGDFGNARGRLSDLLAKYLIQVLRKAKLEDAGDKVTFVIVARAAEWHDLPKGRIGNIGDIDAFQVEIDAGEQPTVRIAGNTAVGAGFGVMYFLEQYLGVVWLFPGDLGVHIPERSEIILPAGRRSVSPAFYSRLCTGFVYRDRSIPGRKFAYEGVVHRQRIFFYSYDYYRSLKLHNLASPSHNMIHIFPVKETQESNPDLLPLKENGERHIPPEKGKGRTRGAYQCWHPCYTNAKAVEIAVAKAKEAFESGALCFSLGINDGRRVRCQCENCRAVGWPDSYYQFVSRVADRVKEYYPPQLIGVLAYGDVASPPRDLVLPENVLVLCASGGPERLERWSPHAQMLGTYEWAHGQGYWYPNLPLAAMERNADYYRKRKVRFFRAEMHPLWAFDGPRVRLRLAQLWNPDLDLDAAPRKYCVAAFGSGGDAMTRLYRHWADKRKADFVEGGVAPHHAGGFRRGHWRNILNQFTFCTQADYDFSLDRIREAKGVAEDGKPRKRLDMVETFFQESANLYGMHLLRNRVFDLGVRTDPAADVAEASRRLGTRNALLTTMRDRPEWFEGISAGVDENLIPSWEARGANPLPNEMRNVFLTTMVRRRRKRAPLDFDVPPELRSYDRPFKEQSLRINSRPKHPWYPESYFVKMDGPRRDTTIPFETRPTTPRIQDHPTLSGKRKLHWLALFVVNAPVNADTAYRFGFDARARSGSLAVDVRAGGHTETAFVEEIGNDAVAIRRSVVFAPVVRDRKTGEPVPNPSADAKTNLNVYMTWVPYSDDSPVEGKCSLTRLEFAPKSR